jgi:hypothetical protein
MTSLRRRKETDQNMSLSYKLDPNKNHYHLSYKSLNYNERAKLRVFPNRVSSKPYSKINDEHTLTHMLQ